MAETAASPPLQRHWRYYFDDGNITLQVDNTLFKLHRSFLCRDRESVFTSMFDLPSGGEPEGTSDKSPIIIPDVSLLLFTDLIRILYSSTFFSLNKSAMQIKQWVEVLELADKFGLESIIPMIASSIEKSPLEERYLVVLLASASRFRRTFSTHFIRELFHGLCIRDTPLSVVEGEELGGALTSLIGKCREDLLRHPTSNTGGPWKGRARFIPYFNELASLSSVQPRFLVPSFPLT